MSAYVESWPCPGPAAAESGSVNGLASIDGPFPGDEPPPAIAYGQVDRAWPWPDYALDSQALQEDSHLHSQAYYTPPTTTTDSGSASSQQANTPASSHHDAPPMQPSTTRTHIARPKQARASRQPKPTGPSRKMRSHRGVKVTKPPRDSATGSQHKKRPRKQKEPAPPPQLDDQYDDDEEEEEDEDVDFDEDEDDDEDDDDLPKDPHRRNNLERNRITAKKCRVRKRDEASALASREQAVEDQNRYLSTCYNTLSTEIYFLKSQLLCHTHCNCTLIQEYIANEARRSMDKLNALPSATLSGSHTTPTELENHRRRSGYFDNETLSPESHRSFDNSQLRSGHHTRAGGHGSFDTSMTGSSVEGWANMLQGPDSAGLNTSNTMCEPMDGCVSIEVPSLSYGRSHSGANKQSSGPAFDNNSHPQHHFSGQMLDPAIQFGQFSPAFRQ